VLADFCNEDIDVVLVLVLQRLQGGPLSDMRANLGQFLLRYFRMSPFCMNDIGFFLALNKLALTRTLGRKFLQLFSRL